MAGRLESLSLSEAPDAPESNVPFDIIEATQKSADLYHSGAKLYVGGDLERVEHELCHYQNTPFFTIRRIDGSRVSVKNPMYGVSRPMWKPYIRFHHYWHMVRGSSVNWYSFPPCYSYCVGWGDLADEQFTESAQIPLGRKFEEVRKQWDRSLAHDWLASKLKKLQGARRITKILCFGLGNMSRLLFSDMRGSTYDSGREERSQLHCMTQHAVALNLVDIFKSATTDVKLFVQDPNYNKASKTVLESAGITIVGECGAGGFSMIDDETLVFFCCPSAPVMQIVADVGRPAMIIADGDRSDVINGIDSIPYQMDAESPRTREMMEEYTPYDLEDKDEMISFNKMKIYVRDEEVRSMGAN
ncbi:hypothetical protein F4818DRAFT_457133 [Hypoxylon cercidicola]|nr:hypothetical protein F4818DRAFT_457133 [Hypoxylon cercidicola]